MQYSATSCIYLIGLYTKEKFTYTCFKNLDLANSFLTREFPDKGSACESRAFFTDISSVLQLLTMLLNQGINVRITQLFCFRKTSTSLLILLQLQLCNSHQTISFSIL